MKSDRATQATAELTAVRQHLTDVRNTLLQLHKTLVDSERVGYEAAVGAIQSPNHFLHLLTHDPWFVWLHPLSQLVVSMDEALDGKEPLTIAKADALVSHAYALLVASEIGEGFSRHYFDSLQRDPDVVLAHAEVAKLRGPRKTSSDGGQGTGGRRTNEESGPR